MSVTALPDPAAAPRWDRALWKAAGHLTDDPEVANAMTVYECRWFTGQHHHWDAEHTRRFLEAEDRLTHAIRR